MIQEQWQVQMWSKVLTRIEREENLIYCALEIPDAEYEHLPGVAGFKLLDQSERQNLTDEEKITRITEEAIQRAIVSVNVPNPSIVLLKDGPYGIPEVIK